MELSSILRAVGGGALLGLASAIALVGNGRFAGISGILGRAFVPDSRAFNLAFLAGLVATGLAAALFFPSAIGAPVRGMPMLAAAGLLVGFGTTLANGCTTGHGVCGLSRGSPRSLVAVVTFMVTGAITVAIAGAHA